MDDNKGLSLVIMPILEFFLNLKFFIWLERYLDVLVARMRVSRNIVARAQNISSETVRGYK